MDENKYKPGFRDSEKEYETTTLGVLVEYKYLKFNDIEWIYGILREAANEVVYQDSDVKEKIQQPRDVQVLVHTASTGKSIELEFILVASQSLKGADIDTIYKIVSIGYLAKKLYDYLKRESQDGRYISRRRANIDRMTVSKRTRRFGPEGRLEEETVEVAAGERVIVEEFDVEIHGSGGRKR